MSFTTLRALAVAAGFATAACQSPATTRVDPPARTLTPAPMPLPPPAPQVMVAPPTVAPLAPAQVVLPPPATTPAAPSVPPASGNLPPVEHRPSVRALTEAERDASFRSLVGAPRTYAPAPLPARRVVERVVYHDVRPVRYARRYDYEPWESTLARTAVYTGVGAIIGHQYHHRGRGAAIGAGLALLTSPWRWYGGYDGRWGGGCDW